MTRPQGKFLYHISTEDHFVAEIESGVEIRVGDEIEYRGNRLLVKDKLGSMNVLTVKLVGHVIKVKDIGTGSPLAEWVKERIKYIKDGEEPTYCGDSEVELWRASRDGAVDALEDVLYELKKRQGDVE